MKNSIYVNRIRYEIVRNGQVIVVNLHKERGMPNYLATIRLPEHTNDVQLIQSDHVDCLRHVERYITHNYRAVQS